MNGFVDVAPCSISNQSATGKVGGFLPFNKSVIFLEKNDINHPSTMPQ